MKPKVNYIKFDNKKFLNVSVGKGFHTVFIPGWMAMPDELPFNKILNEENQKFLENFELNFLQLSNFYKSSYSETPYGLEEYAQELKQVIEAKDWKKINLIGHSAGGRHVLYFAAKFPELVNKLVLMNAAGLKSPKLTEQRLSRAKFYFAKFLAGKKYKEKILKPTFANLYKSDLTDLLPEIKAETLIIWGQKDTEMNIRKAYKFQELIKNSKLKVFEKIGHMTINHAEVYEEIFKFMS